MTDYDVRLRRMERSLAFCASLGLHVLAVAAVLLLGCVAVVVGRALGIE